MRDHRIVSSLPAVVPMTVLASLAAFTGCGASSPDAGEGAAGTSLSAVVATTTKTALTANDTSASSLFRDEYTPARRFDGARIGVVSNGDNPAAPVTAATLADGSVSKVSVHTLLPAGATIKIFAETQSWFCTNGNPSLTSAIDADQCGSHIDIGYDTNTTGHVEKQVADMRSRGIDGAIVDWEGQGAGKGVLDAHSTSSTAINTGSLFAFKAAAEASGGAFQLAVMEDEGVKSCAGSATCDITQAVLSDLGFLASNFFGSSAYYRSAGRPVVFFFGVDYYASQAGKTIDWGYVRAHAPGNPLFVFENAGAYGHAASDGAYSWVKATPIGSYPGADPFGLSGYFPDYYAQSAGHASMLTFGTAFKGFDDHVVNGWAKSGEGRRYAGQACGKTWLETFKLASSHASILDGLQLPTWDDYEEGTELESGIDNHLAIASTMSGSVVDWTLGAAAGAPADCTDAIAAGFDLQETVHHFAVYASPAGDGENLSLVADDLPPSTRSFDLNGKLASGAWTIYVRAVGQPSIKNQLTAGVAWNGGTGTGGGCSGVPTILEPTASENVGPSIHLRVSAPACIQAMIAYVDGNEAARVSANAFDVWVPVAMGSHVLNVNGWAGTNVAHQSVAVAFTRTY